MRWLACLLLVASIAAGNSPAHADKPKLAILTLTPRDASMPFPESRVNALLAAMRTSTKGYVVKGTTKQVEAAIRAGDCSPEQPACAAKLGAALGADYTITGVIERRGKTDVMSLVLVDVQMKRLARTLRDTSPSTSDTRTWAKLAIGRLLDASGELVLSANAPSGEVYLDGQLVGALHQGRALLGGLANGKHRLRVEARGFKPFEVDIEVKFSTKHSVLLEPES